MKKKLIDWETLWHLINAGDADYCMKCEHRTSADGCFYATRPLDCPIWASLEDAVIPNRVDMIYPEDLKLSTEKFCTCGGNGPGDGCPACEIYHDLVYPRVQEREAENEDG